MTTQDPLAGASQTQVHDMSIGVGREGSAGSCPTICHYYSIASLTP